MSFLDPPRPRRPRRFAVLRVMLRPRAAALLLDALAGQADINRLAAGAVIRAHVAACVPQPLRRG